MAHQTCILFLTRPVENEERELHFVQQTFETQTKMVDCPRGEVNFKHTERRRKERKASAKSESERKEKTRRNGSHQKTQ